MAGQNPYIDPNTPAGSIYYSDIEPHESGGNWQARNPEGSAFGKGQLLASNVYRVARELNLNPKDYYTNEDVQNQITGKFLQEQAAAIQKAGLPVNQDTLTHQWHYGNPGNGKTYGYGGSAASASSGAGNNSSPASFVQNNSAGGSDDEDDEGDIQPAGFTAQQTAQNILSGRGSSQTGGDIAPAAFVQSPEFIEDEEMMGNMEEQPMPAMPVDVSGGGDEEPMMGMQQNGTIGIGAIPAAQ